MKITNMKGTSVRIHLVSGFLGSGKTTAIANAAKLLSEERVRTGVVTNDQGKYLVDSKFMQFEGIASSDVTGSCFCCNFTEFEKQIRILRESAHPAVIFAESVGSCTDLVATVIKPLLRFHEGEIHTVTLSGFVDARLLLQNLRGISLPFTADTNYIWAKQIEEAQILVVNKVDLLPVDDLTGLKELVRQIYPHKTVLFQNSLDPDSVQSWLSLLGSYQAPQTWRTMEVDYQKYGRGEADLAWLDEELTLTGPVSSTVQSTARFIEKLTSKILQRGYPIGHLKFFVVSGSEFVKLSYTTVVDRSSGVVLPFADSASVTVGINARIQTAPEILRDLLAQAVEELRNEDRVAIEEDNASAFRPGYPRPTYRFLNQTAA